MPRSLEGGVDGRRHVASLDLALGGKRARGPYGNVGVSAPAHGGRAQRSAREGARRAGIFQERPRAIVVRPPRVPPPPRYKSRSMPTRSGAASLNSTPICAAPTAWTLLSSPFSILVDPYIPRSGARHLPGRRGRRKCRCDTRYAARHLQHRVRLPMGSHSAPPRRAVCRQSLAVDPQSPPAGSSVGRVLS